MLGVRRLVAARVAAGLRRQVQASIEIVTGSTVPTDATAPVPTTVPTEVPTDVAADVAALDTSCTFFGIDVTIP